MNAQKSYYISDKSISTASQGISPYNITLFLGRIISSYLLTDKGKILLPEGTSIITDIGEREENMELLNSFLEYKNNWNDNNALPFTTEHIDTVKNLVKKIKYQPEIFPTACESILLEYNKNNGDHISFELTKNGKVYYLKQPYKKEIIEKEIKYDEIFTKVNLFYGTK